MSDRRRECDICRTGAPKTNSDNTLTQLNWRFTSRRAVGDKVIVELLCPACWEKRRASLNAGSA